ncbi:MAG: ABC-type transport system, permease protein [Rhodospirillales bacterium]|nr:ABC-type transport system, permease protein [Rhodospirillales bacterium]
MDIQSTSDMTASRLSSEAELAPRASGRTAKARRDLVEGLRKRWLWTAMATQDIRLRYRGSLLGPLWLTLSTGVMILAMGVIYPRLLNADTTKYLPFLTTGLITWQFIASLIIEGCTTFTAAQGIILQAPLPFSIHVYRLVYRNFLVFLHNFAIVPVVLLAFPTPIGPDILLIVPALLLLAVNGAWISTLFGMLSARFRDVPPILTNIVQVLFFVTPIFWAPDALGPYQRLAELNPMFAAIDVVRAPLLGVSPAPYSWSLLVALTVLGSAVTFVLFARFRSRISYWI